MVENDDERIFRERRVHNYKNNGESRLGIICCDIEGMRTVLVLMNGEPISHEVGG